MRRAIAISGDLGSGKSTVAVELSQRLGLRKISLGEIHREMARSRGMTALQLNQHSDRDPEVDAYVDGLQRQMASTGEPLIVDSRLAWHFFDGAFKVMMMADPIVAARRALVRPSTKTEAYGSVDEALVGLRERSDSERERFIKTYGVDKSRLRNYSLVCDTTSASPLEVVEVIISEYEADRSDSPVLYLDPRRIRVASSDPAQPGHPDLRVVLSRSGFVAIAGQAELEAALERGDSLIRAHLVAQSDEDDVLPQSTDRALL